MGRVDGGMSQKYSAPEPRPPRCRLIRPTAAVTRSVLPMPLLAGLAVRPGRGSVGRRGPNPVPHDTAVEGAVL
jgi:hypothetical protein